MGALSSQQFGERSAGKHCLAYLLPATAKDETLFVKPDVNGEAGVHVHDYDQLREVIKGKSAHKFDYDTGEFRRAKVHHWLHSDAMPDGGHRPGSPGSTRPEVTWETPLALAESHTEPRSRLERGSGLSWLLSVLRHAVKQFA